MKFRILTLMIMCGSAMAAVKPSASSRDWWSLRPVKVPAVPQVPAGVEVRTPVDAFIAAKLAAEGLRMAPEADRGTLIRRLSFDLTGLPPSPAEVESFVNDRQPRAWERLVDRLLESPRYGERWARHWLDVVHYGDTHGYDKDQPRPNAWPYRDYVIRAFNEDRPWARFISEQLAGDVLYPGTRDGVEALGFISAGPWDLIGHAEVPEEKIDGKVARHLDRDDMVANTINTFCSLTVHCAQCHDHKFDPIRMEDYYSLQSVFAALDRADREYDMDPAVAKQRTELKGQQQQWKQKADALTAKAGGIAGEALAAVDRLIADRKTPGPTKAAQMGWHSEIEPKPDVVKWVQVDIGTAVPLSQVVLHPCRDDFNGIGDGFGFPVRFRVEASDDAAFSKDVRVIADETRQDYPNPKVRAVSYGTGGSARYLRITATKLVPRMNDYIFALAELEILDAAGRNYAIGATVTSLDSIEAAPRWQRTNLTDGVWPGRDPAKAVKPEDTASFEEARRLILEGVLGPESAKELRAAREALDKIEAALKALPAPAKVYCGTVHSGSGAFSGTGAKGGRPRPVYVLSRGDVTRPGPEAAPGTISAVEALPAKFAIPADAPEGARRAALAAWITSPDNPLTWRSAVNRIWQYHFGRGLVETPNDFGRMGQLPVHPELLDWLAAEFRDKGGSIKSLHRLIVNSAVYRQRSEVANPEAEKVDGGNALLWHMNRRRLEAEAIRDSILAVSGMLDLTPGGPAFQDFVIEHPEHSPHYEYHLADLENPALHRRSVYRFLVRSKPQPWMATLDCADPSMLVEKRSQTITPLQALAQLNNQLTLVAARRFAARLEKECADPERRIALAFRLALSREGSADECRELAGLARQHGLPAACRVLLNLNEFVFVD